MWDPPKGVATHILKLMSYPRIATASLSVEGRGGAPGSASQAKLLLESFGEPYKYTGPGRW